jgi:2-amino-4-hydroxy-6-hydroxymethyldihydropteridine diphosphokinase
MPIAYLGLGANIGDPLRQMQAAVQALRAHPALDVLAVSSLYRTRPVGGEPQPDYLNAVLAVATDLPAKTLLEFTLQLEAQAGRVRNRANAPRPLDIDLLLYGQAVLSEPVLSVPHPRMAERAFVLAPLAEIAPRVEHPLLQTSMAELNRRVSGAGVEQLAGGAAWASVR